jgi:transposase
MWGSLEAMQDRDLYVKILGLEAPWTVTDVEVLMRERTVNVHVSRDPHAPLECPECGQRCPRYDGRVRRWRHLDTMQFETMLIAEVPRSKCQTHGVLQVRVPWAEENSRFTALFECLVIDWLKEASIVAVSRLLGLSWDEAAGIQERAVRRGLARRRNQATPALGIDETSFKKRHEYVSVICDLKRAKVLHVLDGRGKEPVVAYFKAMPKKIKSAIEAVTMDMWEPFISAVSEQLPQAAIAFDRFHIAKHLNDAVDKVRRSEHRELTGKGDQRLVRTKYLWLQNPEDMSPARRTDFLALRDTSLRVARAWALKEHARHLWYYRRRSSAEASWKWWIGWAQRCRLTPIVKVGRMIKAHFEGVINAAVLGITNAMNESFNSRIQRVKRLANGFRNRERFKNAIYFHLGDLDLYPAP